MFQELYESLDQERKNQKMFHHQMKFLNFLKIPLFEHFKKEDYMDEVRFNELIREER